jgi:hypothetical protein
LPKNFAFSALVFFFYNWTCKTKLAARGLHGARDTKRQGYIEIYECIFKNKKKLAAAKGSGVGKYTSV